MKCLAAKSIVNDWPSVDKYTEVSVELMMTQKVYFCIHLSKNARHQHSMFIIVDCLT